MALLRDSCTFRVIENRPARASLQAWLGRLPAPLLSRGVAPASASSTCRRLVGQDLMLPTHALLLNNGDKGSLTLASQRFYHILRVTTSAGEHEKVVQVTVLTSALATRVLNE